MDGTVSLSFCGDFVSFIIDFIAYFKVIVAARSLVCSFRSLASIDYLRKLPETSA
jgi:hypothetical protein